MKYTKILALLLVLVMTVSAMMLVSCNENTDGPDVTQGTDDTTASVAETTAPAPTALTLVKDKKAIVKVIRNEDAKNESSEVLNATSIRTYIGSVTGATPVIETDWVKRGTEHNHDTVEILVGHTDYSESKKVYETLSYGAYAIKVVGNKIVVAGFTDSAISTACTKLKSIIKENTKENGDLELPTDIDINIVADKVLDSIPTVDGATMNAACKAAGEADLIYLTDASEDIYKAYTAKLETLGYKKYTDHTITNNLFSTYTSGKTTLTAIYYGYNKTIRVISETNADPAGLASENNYKTVTTPCIVSNGVGYMKNETDEQNIALSMIIRLSDGRFVVVDGGYSARSADMTLVNTRLHELSESYINSADYMGNGKIVVAAWIYTHPHGDHIGAFTSYYTNLKDVKIEKILNSVWSDSEQAKARDTYSGNYDSGEGEWKSKTDKVVSALKTTLHVVRPGQVFYLGDAVFECLYTVDSLTPSVINAVNTMSTVYKVTFSSGTTFMITGDATGNAFSICNNMYGNYMKCDIMQLSHHGCSTWGNDSATAKAYTLIAPATVIWPSTENGYLSRRTKNYNVTVFSSDFLSGGQNKEFKEIYWAGMEGEYVLYNIPYTVGSAVVVRNNK